MTRRHAGAVLASLAVTVGLSFSLFASAPVAAAQVAPASPASVSTTTSAAAVTPACKKAKKVVKKTWKARVAAKASGNIDRFVAADQKWRKAKVRKAKACRVTANPVTPATFSGDSDDPRPAGWVRPADGSGLPGSNAGEVQVETGCPITVSRYSILKNASNPYAWYHLAYLENFSDKDYKYAWRVTLVDADGTIVDSGETMGSTNAWEQGEDTWTSFTFMVDPKGTFDISTARTLKYTITQCSLL